MDELGISLGGYWSRWGQAYFWLDRRLVVVACQLGGPFLNLLYLLPGAPALARASGHVPRTWRSAPLRSVRSSCERGESMVMHTMRWNICALEAAIGGWMVMGRRILACVRAVLSREVFFVLSSRIQTRMSSSDPNLTFACGEESSKGDMNRISLYGFVGPLNIWLSPCRQFW